MTVPVIDIPRVYEKGISEELIRELDQRSLQADSIVLRVYDASKVPIVQEFGTDRQYTASPEGYSALQYVDAKIKEELGLTEMDVFFGLSLPRHEEYLLHELRKRQKPAISVYDRERLSQVPGISVFYFLEPSSRKDALVAIFRLQQ